MNMYSCESTLRRVRWIRRERTTNEIKTFRLQLQIGFISPFRGKTEHIFWVKENEQSSFSRMGDYIECVSPSARHTRTGTCIPACVYLPALLLPLAIPLSYTPTTLLSPPSCRPPISRAAMLLYLLGALRLLQRRLSVNIKCNGWLVSLRDDSVLTGQRRYIFVAGEVLVYFSM